jgi:hypothetical protein
MTLVIGRRRLGLVQARPLALAGPPSFRLSARREDHGAMWPAVSRRCRQALPPELGWASPLFELEPVAVVCGCDWAEALYRWLDSLPTPVQASVCCERRRAPAARGLGGA